MYEVTVSTTISASHHLINYQGKCENVHGHNYKIEATVKTDQLDDVGLALDFGILKEHLRSLTDRFDHTDLNQAEDFSKQNPSSENLARVIFNELKKSLEANAVEVVCVKVWESEGSCVSYSE